MYDKEFKELDVVDLIRQYQKQETHPILRSEFSIIVGGKNLSPIHPRRSPQRENLAWSGRR